MPPTVDVRDRAVVPPYPAVRPRRLLGSAAPRDAEPALLQAISEMGTVAGLEVRPADAAAAYAECGRLAFHVGRWTEAGELLDVAVHHARGGVPADLRGAVLGRRAELHLLRGRRGEAIAHLDEAEAAWSWAETDVHRAYVEEHRARIALAVRDGAEAGARAMAAEYAFHDQGDIASSVLMLGLRAEAHLARGDADAAAVFTARVDGVSAALGRRPDPALDVVAGRVLAAQGERVSAEVRLRSALARLRGTSSAPDRCLALVALHRLGAARDLAESKAWGFEVLRLSSGLGLQLQGH